jgi:hypothetical protein
VLKVGGAFQADIEELPITENGRFGHAPQNLDQRVPAPSKALTSRDIPRMILHLEEIMPGLFSAIWMGFKKVSCPPSPQSGIWCGFWRNLDLDLSHLVGGRKLSETPSRVSRVSRVLTLSTKMRATPPRRRNALGLLILWVTENELEVLGIG